MGVRKLVGSGAIVLVLAAGFGGWTVAANDDGDEPGVEQPDLAGVSWLVDEPGVEQPDLAAVSWIVD